MTISRTIAKLLSGGGPETTLAAANALVADVRAQARRAPRIVGVVSGLKESAERAAKIPVKVVDRVSWAEGATTSLLSMLDGEPSLSRTQVSLLLSAISYKVLGQFDPYSADEGVLFVVAPNLAEFRERYDLDRRDLALWVAVHESTHATQFMEAPWLAPYLKELATSLLDEGSDETLEKIKAVMSLLEGHASWMMDNVPLRLIPSRRRLATALQARRNSGSSLRKLLKPAVDIDSKNAQYSRGENFTTTVVEQAGIETFNKVWLSAENLPTMEEFEKPELWIERIKANDMQEVGAQESGEAGEAFQMTSPEARE